MAYRVVILAEALEEMRRFFPLRERQRITRKIRHIADNVPESLKLRGVTYLKGAESALERIGGDAAYEVRIGYGYRAAFVLYNSEQLIRVYLAASHDYANELFLQALSRFESD